jgi:hypothetical protein
MANSFNSRKWDKQPHFLTEIDRNNPLARGLRVAYNPAAHFDAARGIPLAIKPALGASVYGVAAIGDGTNYAQFPSLPAPASASFTLFSISRFTNGNCILSIENEYTNQWRIQPYPSGANLVVNGMGDYSLGAKSGYTDYTKLTICCDSGVTNGTRSYRERVLVSTNTVTMGTLSGNYPVSINSKRYIPTTNGAGDDNALVLFWDRPLSEAEVFALNENPWQVFLKRPQILYFDVGGGATVTATTSLSAAIQQSQSATTSLSAAIQQAFNASASLDAAIQQARTASASLDSYVVVTGTPTLTASLNAAIQEARSVVSSLDAAIQQARSGVSSLDAAISAEHTATAGLDAYIAVAGSTLLTASLSAAISEAHTATASLSAAIQQARNSTTSIDALLATERAATVGVDGYISAGFTATASLDAAVMAAHSAIASLDALILTGPASEIRNIVERALVFSKTLSASPRFSKTVSKNPEF